MQCSIFCKMPMKQKMQPRIHLFRCLNRSVLLKKHQVYQLVHPVLFQQVTNKPERADWFQDLGFGMFLHWNVDGTLGAVICHSLAGSSPEHTNKYFSELPKYFNPKKFNPTAWARLAKLAGMKYVIFTTKHHSCFCMWNTKTTDFNVMNTPFGRDIWQELFQAFRKEGIAIGVYFSPEDFY